MFFFYLEREKGYPVFIQVPLFKAGLLETRIISLSLTLNVFKMCLPFVMITVH